MLELYKRIPGTMYDIRISNRGVLKSFDPEIPTPTISRNAKGYLTSWCKLINGKNLTFRIHRFVGILFIAVPPTLKDLELKTLQINHLDGNKNNNGVDNLEWCTNSDNMKHARATGLFSNERPVNYYTTDGVLQGQYRSLSEASRVLGICSVDLHIHLNQKTAGCVVFKDKRYTYANVEKPCTTPIHPSIVIKFNHQYKVTARNHTTGEMYLFTSVPEAALALGLRVNVMKNNNTRKGYYFDPLKPEWSFSIDSENNLKKLPRKVIAWNPKTDTKVTYNSSRICSQKLKIPHDKLHQHLNGYFWGMLPWDNLYFKYDHVGEFPKTQYLVPDSRKLGLVINLIVTDTQGTKFLVSNLTELATFLGVSRSDIYNHRHVVGRDVPYMGYYIEDISETNIRELTQKLRFVL